MESLGETLTHTHKHTHTQKYTHRHAYIHICTYACTYTHNTYSITGYFAHIYFTYFTFLIQNQANLHPLLVCLMEIFAGLLQIDLLLYSVFSRSGFGGRKLFLSVFFQMRATKGQMVNSFLFVATTQKHNNLIFKTSFFVGKLPLLQL